VAAADGYAYLMEQFYGLRVSDVSNPAHPVEIGYQRIPGSILDIDIAGGYAYVADEFYGLWVLDISDPTQPAVAGSCEIPEATQVALSGDHAYVVSRDGTGWGDNLYIVDISDPAHPTQVGFFEGTFNISGLVAVGSTLYLSSFSDGLRVLDVSDPAHPLEIGAFEALPHADGVAVAGDYAYVAVDKSLWVIDVSDGANPIEVGVYHAPGTFTDWATGVSVTVAGDIVYIANGSGAVAKRHDGLRVIDVSDPSSPDLVGYYDTPGSAYDVFTLGGYAFVADGYGGLLILKYTGAANARR
jgi:hypothetical protein